MLSLDGSNNNIPDSNAPYKLGAFITKLDVMVVVPECSIPVISANKPLFSRNLGRLYTLLSSSSSDAASRMYGGSHCCSIACLLGSVVLGVIKTFCVGCCGWFVISFDCAYCGHTPKMDNRFFSSDYKLIG